MERELAELDRNLESIEAEEKSQMEQIKSFESYKQNIEQDERQFWTEFN